MQTSRSISFFFYNFIIIKFYYIFIIKNIWHILRSTFASVVPHYITFKSGVTHHRLWPSGLENMDSSAIYWNNWVMLGNSHDNSIIIFPQKGNMRGATTLKKTVDEL